MLSKPPLNNHFIHMCKSKSIKCDGIGFLSPQQLGMEFENQVHFILANNLQVKNLLREKEIKRLYGANCSGIDHMFDIPFTNISICIQDKWTNSKSPISTINHFMKCVQNINVQTNRSIQGIFLSKLPITKPSLQAFEFDNKSQHKVNFINISLEIQEQEQEQLIEKMLHYFHYTYKLWTYDFDGCIKMRI